MVKFVHDNLRDYVASRFFFNLGTHLVMAFMPLVMLSHGLSLTTVLAFNAVQCAISTLALYPIARLVARFGLRVGFIWAYCTAAAYHVAFALTLDRLGPGWLLLLAALLGTSQMMLMFTIPLHVSQAMDPERKGRDMAFIQAALRLVGVIGPLVGAVIAVTAGPGWLMAAAAVMVVAGLGLIWNVDRQTPPGLLPRKVRFRPFPRWQELAAVAALQYHADVGVLVWPVYLAVVTPTFESIGGIVTVAGILTIALMPRFGRHVDNGQGYKLLKRMLIAIVVINLARMVSTDPLWLTVITAGYTAAFSWFIIPWHAMYFGYVRTGGFNYLLAMETVASFANVVVWTVLAVLVGTGFAAGTMFQVAFISAAVVAFGCLLLRRRPSRR